jgi:murein DD-endopeptidase MepM/ murein hydrolase activator NlpD
MEDDFKSECQKNSSLLSLVCWSFVVVGSVVGCFFVTAPLLSFSELVVSEAPSSTQVAEERIAASSVPLVASSFVDRSSSLFIPWTSLLELTRGPRVSGMDTSRDSWTTDYARGGVSEIKESYHEYVFSGVLEGSLYQSLRKVGIDPGLIDDFADVFSGEVDFRKDIRQGDSFILIVEKDMKTGGKVISSGLLEIGNETLYAFRNVGFDKKIRYVNELGQLKGAGLLRYPVQFSRISSVFSDSRLHPVLKKARPHLGVDFAAPLGTPVRAAGGGRVTFAGKNGASGIMIKIDHDGRIASSYLHLSKLEKGIVKGRAVAKGDVIGFVGQTGLASGPHLHFSLWDRGQYVDPLNSKITSSFSDELIKVNTLSPRVDLLKSLHKEATEARLALQRLGPKGQG